MAYSIIEQQSQDLDIFLRDGSKMIHFASGGGLLPEGVVNSDLYNGVILNAIANFNPQYEIDINPNLADFLNLDAEGIESYIPSFVEMAKRGFYSYDKSSLGDFNDQTFHLVAKPRRQFDTQNLSERFAILREAIRARNVLPENFDRFNILQFI